MSLESINKVLAGGNYPSDLRYFVSNSRFVLKASIHEVFATVFRKFF